MTVKELIEELHTYPQDMNVYVQNINGESIYLDYNDHLNIVLENLSIQYPDILNTDDSDINNIPK